MQYVLGGLVLLFLLATLWGATAGRLKASSCCSIADPSRDLRMREAFQPEQPDS